MKAKLLTFVDRNQGVWVLEYRNEVGEMIMESTAFPENTPCIVVCDALQRQKPRFAIFAKLG